MPTFKKIIWSIVNNIVDILIGMGILVVVTRYYNPEIAGKWILFITIFYMITKIRETMMQTAMNKLAAGRTITQQMAVLKATLLFTVLFEALASIILFVLGILNTFPSLTEFFLYYPICAVIWAVYRWQIFAHLMSHQVENIFKSNIGVMIILILGLSYIAYYTLPVENILIVMGIAGTIGAINGIRLIGFKSLFYAQMSREVFKGIVYYGSHGMMRGSINTISNRINIFFTASLLTFVDTAMIGLAYRYSQLILLPNGAIQSLVLPKFCEAANMNDKQTVKTLFEESVSLLLSLFLLLMVIASLTAHWLIPLIHGEEYGSGVPIILIIMLLTALFMPFGNAFGSVINALEKPQVNTYLLLMTSSLNISISFFAMKEWGLWGAVIGTTISETAGFTVLILILKKEIDISLKQCFYLIPTHYLAFLIKAKALAKKVRKQL
ncbi:polysaccharide biosynthesis C-terminal domain-containing protein [Limibacter armeniacum]|uniref:lipopolysaccharide biosynthesis protein n=1 Tax=Limibacter armeniacum TaxID=466084 RepID=UPI002FE55862